MTHIILWFILGYLVWKLLQYIVPIRAKVIVRVRPTSAVNGLLLPDDISKNKDMSIENFEALVKARFVQITSAFASGQMHYVKNFMTDKVYLKFDEAVKLRSQKGHTLDFRLVDFKKVASDKGEKIRWVEFTTEQVNVLKDGQNQVIEGDPLYLSSVHEKWQFQWDEKLGWLLSAVQTVDAHAI